MKKCAGWIALVGLAAATRLAAAEPLTMIAYNVESGGAEAATVAQKIEAIEGVDLWGFSELAGWPWLEVFQRAAERGNHAEFGSVIGTTGDYDMPDRDPDNLALLYRKDRLELLGHRELHAINDWAHRSPLVAEFRIKESGTTFLVVLNHLASGDAKLRIQQSWQLREWAFFRKQPVIMIGDFNYRWRIGKSDDDPPRGYDALTRGSVMTWVRPSPLINTWCGGAPTSVFDFTFVNPLAQAWKGQSDVIESDCVKSSQKVSDHRPVRVRFQIPEPDGAYAPTAR
jgi:endonuclease/exonuclease/phosphatase family metal-dependent hydrolase